MDIQFPKVTIMIPTYNQAKYVGQAIESALAQDYPNLEVVVGDDCSADETQTVVSRYVSDSRLRYVRHAANLGRTGNYHHLLCHEAQGEWVVNLDGDDYYTDPHFVSAAIDNIRAATAAGFSIVAHLYKHPHLEKIKELCPCHALTAHSLVLSGKGYLLRYYDIGSFGHLSTLYRRDLAVRTNAYVETYQASDFTAVMRVALLGDVILDSRSVGKWRTHATNTTYQAVEQKLPQAMQAYDDIMQAARACCTEGELSLWRQRMDASAYNDYVETYISCRRDLKALRLLLSRFRLRYAWFAQCYRFIFRS